MKLSPSEHEKLLKINLPCCPEAWLGVCLPLPDDVQSLIDKGALEALDGSSFVRVSEAGRAYCKYYQEAMEAFV